MILSFVLCACRRPQAAHPHKNGKTPWLTGAGQGVVSNAGAEHVDKRL
ncbi:MAG: hypothetical protein ACFNYP_04135 [Corynebacterium matruchotii]